MKKYIGLLGLVLVTVGFNYAQEVDFTVRLKSKQIEGLGGTHSYAFGQHDGKWLIIGGRKDGLHARQPFNAFPATYNNDDLLVIDPELQEVWSYSLSSFPITLNEQLQATNMCFNQVEDTLYIAGGYAFSQSMNDHVTFPYLTTVIVSEAIEAIVNGNNPSAAFKQVMDERMAVTGGHLAHFEDQWMLVGGHRFDGRYNPMGHNTYEQSYTDAIRSFQVNNSGSNPQVSDFSEVVDAVHLHRRDYNLIPQIYGDGSFGYMISSGVFQQNVDLPFLYPVEITSSGHNARTEFNQYLSNYHSATVTLFDSNTMSTHSIFFGGMARYYYENETLVEDDNVPFVSTISMLSRNANDDLVEVDLGVSMPDLKGASAEFIPNRARKMIQDQVVIIPSLRPDSMLLGHIYGGIHSTQSNPFANNNTAVTSADETVYEVWLVNQEPTSIKQVNGQHSFVAEVYPNPSKGNISAKLQCPSSGNGFLLVSDQSGRLVHNLKINDLYEGENRIQLFESGVLDPGIYHFHFSFEDSYYEEETVIVK